MFACTAASIRQTSQEARHTRHAARTEFAHDVLALPDLVHDRLVALAHGALLLLEDKLRVLLDLVRDLLPALEPLARYEVNEPSLERRGTKLERER